MALLQTSVSTSEHSSEPGTRHTSVSTVPQATEELVSQVVAAWPWPSGFGRQCRPRAWAHGRVSRGRRGGLLTGDGTSEGAGGGSLVVWWHACVGGSVGAGLGAATRAFRLAFGDLPYLGRFETAFGSVRGSTIELDAHPGCFGYPRCMF